MGRIAFIGLPGYKFQSTAIGATEVPTKPKSNLSDPQPWRKCRIMSKDPAKTYIHVQLELPLSYYAAEFAVGGIATVNHNQSIGGTQRAMVLDTDASGYLPVNIAPDAVVLGGVWSGGGVVGDIDDDPYAFADDGGIETNTPGTGTLRIQFPTPDRNPMQGADLQAFCIAISSDQGPTALAFKLYENGVERATLDYSIAGVDPRLQSHAALDRVLIIPWNAADLQTADGSLVELAIEVEIGTGDDVAVAAVTWLCQMELSGGTLLHDTLWVRSNHEQPSSRWGSTSVGTVGRSPQQTHIFLPQVDVGSGAARVVVQFRDPMNAVGYIDVGRLLVGPAFIPSRNRDWGSLVEFEPRDVVVDGESGSWFGSRRRSRRKMPIPLPWMEPIEEWVVLADRMERAGQLTPFVVATVDADSVEARHVNLYCRVVDPPKVDLPRHFGNQRSVVLSVVEVL